MVYIIILTWNGKKYLASLFNSLAGLNYPREKIKIVALDSGSTDGSIEYLENLHLSNFKLIKLDKNLGFAKGSNIGIQYGLDNSAEYLVLLNQDTALGPDFLTELVEVAKSNEKIGIVQPLILYYKNRNEINSWGNELHYLGYGMSGGNHKAVETRHRSLSSGQTRLVSTDNINITYASAAAVLYKAELLRRIGLFDENIFAYHEDSDICLRAKLAGYKTVLASDSIAYHDYSFPVKKDKDRYFLMEKNRLYIIFKFYKIKTLLLILPMLVFMNLGQLIFAIKNGYIWQFIKSWLWFILNFKKFYSNRCKIQKSRQISDRELTKDFVSEIKYQEVSNWLLDKVGNPVMRGYWRIIKRLI